MPEWDELDQDVFHHECLEADDGKSGEDADEADDGKSGEDAGAVEDGKSGEDADEADDGLLCSLVGLGLVVLLEGCLFLYSLESLRAVTY